MKYLFFILCLVMLVPAALSYASRDKVEYRVANIPANLLIDANAIVRTNTIRFEVKNEQRAVAISKIAVTVFKKEKRDYGYLFLRYDKFREIEDIEGIIYDADGKKVRELDDNDIKDYSAIEGYTLFSDSRVRIAEMYHDQYPYTIEYTYEYSYNGYLNWPTWRSQNTLDAVEQTRFEVLVPKEDTLRYWCSRDSISPNVSIDGSKKLYIWEAKNLAKLSKDIVGDDPEDYATIVRIAPSLFKFDDYPGDMRTWKDFGKWYYSLAIGRDVLPKSAIQDIHTLIQPADDIREKIKKLYQYMQARTRYVSVQLGIGGWQPFDATFVHERGYGDCKALSNYMIALLKEAGIVGYSVFIQSGDHRYPFIYEFPSNQFNHVIACVPLQQDTLWLECTSQSSPFAHIGKNNENRGALLLTPEGGIPVQTPRSTPQQNLQNRSIKAALSLFGNAEVQTIITRHGNKQDDIRDALYNASPQDKERWILNSMGVPNAQLKNYQIDGMDTHELTVTLSMHLAIPRFASASGDRIFFVPNMMQRQTYIPPDIPQRLSPIRYDYPYLDVDTIYYSLPSGYIVESIPKEVKLESSFGSYHANTHALGDTAIIYTRSKEIREYSIPAKNYSEYRKFCADLVKADKAQVVLVRKNR